MKTFHDEIWKDIKGYEGLYQVSNLGRVKSLERRSHKLSTGGVRVYKAAIKKPETMKLDYKRIHLYKNGKLRKWLVHRLVAEMFLDAPVEPIEKMHVNHINGVPSDNRVENLEWVTPNENCKHRSYALNRKPRGVYKVRSRWKAEIVYDQKKVNIGTFDNKSEAYKEFYNKYIELYGVEPWDLNKYKTH